MKSLLECVCAVCLPVSTEDKREHRIPWNWSYWLCATTWCWEPNTGPLEQQVLLATELPGPPSVSPPSDTEPYRSAAGLRFTI